jgi:hypothetical protein
VLVELCLDVVVYADDFLLEQVDQLGDGAVGAILDLVPQEAAEVLVYGLWVKG